MSKDNIYMYGFYESFYEMAVKSAAFKRYCEEVYGVDFSQDGFSDLNEVNDLIKKTSICKDSVVLDVGCGSGGMCEYIHRQTSAVAYGFDYSDTAINCARERVDGNNKLHFDVGVFGEWEYPSATFDVIISVDTMYFVDDTEAFLKQIYSWLKPGGLFAAMYGCYDKIEPNIDKNTTSLANALRNVGFSYEVVDYTESNYRFLKRKRLTAERMTDDFRQEGLEPFCNRIIIETIENPNMTLDDFSQHYSRYMYLIRKGGCE